MQKAQSELAEMEITGQAGGGMVSVVMTGRHEVRRVSIDESVYDDREMVEDLVAAAFNDAAQKLDKETQERMGGLTDGLDLPPGMKMPF
jgi:DNA-binding YbaB/EbfC family protein